MFQRLNSLSKTNVMLRRILGNGEVCLSCLHWICLCRSVVVDLEHNTSITKLVPCYFNKCHFGAFPGSGGAMGRPLFHPTMVKVVWIISPRKFVSQLAFQGHLIWSTGHGRFIIGLDLMGLEDLLWFGFVDGPLGLMKKTTSSSNRIVWVQKVLDCMLRVSV